MNRGELDSLIEEAIESMGEAKLARQLESLIASNAGRHDDVLTVIVNAGVHHLPEKLKRGEVFIASEGSLDFSSQESIEKEFTRITSNVAKKLKERDWRRIYLVPFGPANLSMLIKLLVYRVTHVETIDIFYVDGQYREINIQLRPLVVDAK